MSSDLSHATPLIRIAGLNHYYGNGESRHQALFDTNVTIYPGEFVTLTGPSGSGKTTLLTLIGALRSVQEGSIMVSGKELYGLKLKEMEVVRRQIGFIFQGHNLFGALTAYQNVKLATQLCRYPPGEARRRTEKILREVGLGDRMHHKPQKLSGGQKQRVAVARALVNRPALVLGDEPTAALDSGTSGQVVDLFLRLVKKQQSTILIVTHDNRIQQVANRNITQVDGRIISGTET